MIKRGRYTAVRSARSAGYGGLKFEIHLSCLPLAAQRKYLAEIGLDAGVAPVPAPPAGGQAGEDLVPSQAGVSHSPATSSQAQAAAMAPGFFSGGIQGDSNLIQNDCKTARFAYSPEELQRWAASRPETLRAEGARRAELLLRAVRLTKKPTKTLTPSPSPASGRGDEDPYKGVAMRLALALVARESGEKLANLRNWWDGHHGRPGAKAYHRSDLAAALIPGWMGRPESSEMDPLLFEQFKALYLHRKQPCLTIAYEKVALSAAEQGLAWPSMATVRRRLAAEFSIPERVYLREGAEALEKLFPPMIRDRSMFHALQAVNGDGVLFQCCCRFEDGEIARPKVWVWQDVMSGKVLCWRADVSENRDQVRLSVGDLVGRYGIPEHLFIDNTMAAANTWLTAGAKTRYRFKLEHEDFLGILPQLGIEVHFTTPGHGQSKPIERAFRDLRQLMDQHPAFLGRGTQARPVPITQFMAVLDREIAFHNARGKRRGRVAHGRSFDEVFAESFEANAHRIRKPTAEQSRLWLMAAEKCRVSAVACVTLQVSKGPQGENRYWSEALFPYIGSPVVVRFDPRRLDAEIHAYTLDGRYIGALECVFRGGFIDSEAAQRYKRALGQFKKAHKRAAEAKLRLDAVSAQAMTPPVAPLGAPEMNVVRGAFPARRAGLAPASGVSTGFAPASGAPTADGTEDGSVIADLLERIPDDHPLMRKIRR